MTSATSTHRAISARAPVDHRVVDLAGRIVAGVAGLDQFAAQLSAQHFDRCRIGHVCSPSWADGSRQLSRRRPALPQIGLAGAARRITSPLSRSNSDGTSTFDIARISNSAGRRSRRPCRPSNAAARAGSRTAVNRAPARSGPSRRCLVAARWRRPRRAAGPAPSRSRRWRSGRAPCRPDQGRAPRSRTDTTWALRPSRRSAHRPRCRPGAECRAQLRFARRRAVDMAEAPAVRRQLDRDHAPRLLRGKRVVVYQHVFVGWRRALRLRRACSHDAGTRDEHRLQHRAVHRSRTSRSPRASAHDSAAAPLATASTSGRTGTPSLSPAAGRSRKVVDGGSSSWSPPIRCGRAYHGRRCRRL